MVQLKRRVGRTAHDAQCLASGIGEDKSPDLGCRGHGAANKIIKCRVEEFIATVADCIRNESGLIDSGVKVSRSAISWVESARAMRRVANSCTMRRPVTQFMATIKPTDSSTRSPMLSMSVGIRARLPGFKTPEGICLGTGSLIQIVAAFDPRPLVSA